MSYEELPNVTSNRRCYLTQETRVGYNYGDLAIISDFNKT